MAQEAMQVALDEIDRKILILLQENARQSNIELAEKVGLSPAPCLRRVRDLQQKGVIKSYVALLSPDLVGLSMSVFVNVTLKSQREQALQRFEAAIVKRPEVLECYLMTGDADYLLRIVVANLHAYQSFLINHLTRIPGVAGIRSSFALKQAKYLTALPLSGNAARASR